MTYREANKIITHYKFNSKNKPSLDEVQSAYDAFGIKTFHTICHDCSRYTGTCQIFNGQSWKTDKVSGCNFFKSYKKEK